MCSTEGSVPILVGEPDLLPPGAKAGPWLVGSQLGHGGMGTVYSVVHEDIGKRAALKVIHQRLCGGTTAERILVEARVVNRVAHPNIVDIFETGTLTDGRPYIVMERLDGTSLGRHAFEGKILPDRVIDILLQICDALIAAHAAGVIHRDLKVDNVFLLDNPDDPDRPRVKLLDWGIAKEVENDPHRTIEGTLVGTPQYLSPEQARGGEITPATDVYSLGVMAFELFLEQLPFQAETSVEIMTMHIRATPPRPSDLWPDIPTSLEQLLFAMLEKQPEKRPTMSTVARTLELVRDELERRRGLPLPQTRRPASRWSTTRPLSIESPARWRHGSRRWQLAVGAVALIATATMVMVTRDREGVAAAAPPAIVTPAVVPSAAPTLNAPPPMPAEVTVAKLPVVAAPATRPAKPAPRPRYHRATPVKPTPPPPSTIDLDGSIEVYR
jgi:serine/threonine-protein kinase